MQTLANPQPLDEWGISLIFAPVIIIYVMQRYLFLSLLVLISLHSFAQDDLPWVQHRDVRLIDEVTRKQIRGAKFTAYDTHGRKIEPIDFWERSGSYNGKEIFEGYTVELYEFVDTLVLCATVEGHEPAKAVVPLPRDKYKKAPVGNRYYWDDEIRLMTRRSMNIELGEAAVKASRILMVQKGDTIIYNAATLQMSSGSMLNNLVRALPGVQLHANGRITVNGEFVHSLLVNGKDFFKGDPNVALDNLPYYTVDKIKVYHEGVRELKNATRADSLAAEGVEKTLTMDVRLKKEYGEGWLANFEAALGVRTTGDPGLVHRGRAFALRYTDHSKLGVYASANNVGDNHNPTHNGEWREMQAAGSGENTMQNAGLDFSIENKEQTRSFSTTLTGQHNANDTQSRTSAQNFFPTGDIFRRALSQSNNYSGNLNWNASFSQSKKKKYNFSLSPNFSYHKGHGYSQDYDTSYDGGPQDTTRLQQKIITQAQGLGRNDSRTLNAGASASLSVFLPFTKENLLLNAGVRYYERESSSVSFRQTSGRAIAGYDENMRTQSPSHNFSYNAGVSHQLFMLLRKRGWINGKLAYRFNHNSSHSDRRLYKNALPIIGILPDDPTEPSPYWDETSDDFWQLNIPNSYNARETKDDHGVELTSYSIVGHNPKNSFHFNATLPLHIVRRSITDNRNATVQQLHRRDIYFAPNVAVRCGGFSASYQLQPELPSMNDLIDVVDNGSSLYIRKGNPRLRMAVSHDANLGYKFNSPKHSEWFNANAQLNITQHKCMDAVTYDRTTGVTTTQPLNTEGNWWGTAGVTYGRAFDKAKHFNGDVGLRYTFAHSVGFVSDATGEDPVQSLVLNHRIRSNVRLSYNLNQMRVEFNGRIIWNDVNSPRASFEHLRYNDQNYALTFSTPLFPAVGKDKWTIDFDTDLGLNLRRGYREARMNTTEWVWNAALSTRVGKTRQWTLRAVGFDLLHQLTSVTHVLTAQGLTETWTNTVRSYASLHVIYHLQMKPKKGI